jgi:hypothetical protein
MKKVPLQCQAVTPVSTYSQAHRCLKRGVLRKRGGLYLCTHHIAAADRARA